MVTRLVTVAGLTTGYRPWLHISVVKAPTYWPIMLYAHLPIVYGHALCYWACLFARPGSTRFTFCDGLWLRAWLYIVPSHASLHSWVQSILQIMHGVMGCGCNAWMYGVGLKLHTGLCDMCTLGYELGETRICYKVALVVGHQCSGFRWDFKICSEKSILSGELIYRMHEIYPIPFQCAGGRDYTVYDISHV